jgi:hypothetical protein
MDKEPDVIRHEIEQTRSSLTEKLETLESQVKGTVESVKSKVEGTVEAVTSGVESTVETVKRTFDLERQVCLHPLAMTGGTLVLGMAAGYFLSSLRRPAPLPRHWSAPRPAAAMVPPAERFSSGDGAPRRQEPARAGGMLSGVLEQFGPEIDKLKSTAVGMVLGAARDFLKEKLPQSMSAHVDELVDNVTRKAGGEVIRGRVLPEHETSACPTGGTPTV